MIKIYTMVGANPKNHEVYQFIQKVHDLAEYDSKVLEFPEISTTVSGWSYPTPPMELRSNFYSFIKKQLELNNDYIVITFSTLVCYLIRLAAKNLKLRDAVEIYDEKLHFITSVNEKGRLYKVVPGLFDAEEQILFRLVE